ncbi:hypothetical protein EIL50_02905 [bacterium NHP-B]|nr:hypothetical protein EIL50_02905 [bacterium NHP-B]
MVKNVFYILWLLVGVLSHHTFLQASPSGASKHTRNRTLRLSDRRVPASTPTATHDSAQPSHSGAITCTTHSDVAPVDHVQQPMPACARTPQNHLSAPEVGPLVLCEPAVPASTPFSDLKIGGQECQLTVCTPSQKAILSDNGYAHCDHRRLDSAATTATPQEEGRVRFFTTTLSVDTLLRQLEEWSHETDAASCGEKTIELSLVAGANGTLAIPPLQSNKITVLSLEGWVPSREWLQNISIPSLKTIVMKTPHFFPDDHSSCPDVTFEGPFLSWPRSITGETRICMPHQPLLAFSGQDMGYYDLRILFSGPDQKYEQFKQQCPFITFKSRAANLEPGFSRIFLFDERHIFEGNWIQERCEVLECVPLIPRDLSKAKTPQEGVKNLLSRIGLALPPTYGQDVNTLGLPFIKHQGEGLPDELILCDKSGQFVCSSLIQIKVEGVDTIMRMPYNEYLQEMDVVIHHPAMGKNIISVGPFYEWLVPGKSRVTFREFSVIVSHLLQRWWQKSLADSVPAQEDQAKEGETS